MSEKSVEHQGEAQPDQRLEQVGGEAQTDQGRVGDQVAVVVAASPGTYTRTRTTWAKAPKMGDHQVLHRLFAHAGTCLARAMVIFVVFSAGIARLNMVHQLGALLVATTPAYTAAFGTAGSQGMALLLMDIQHYGYLIAQLSWLWLFTLGLLGYRSGLFPRPLALVLMLGTVCYMADALLQFLAPGAAHISTAMFVPWEILSEVSLLLYLLIKGVRTPRPAPTAHTP